MFSGWGALNIFDMHIEVGKAVNKEQEAREWVEGFRKRLEEAGAKIREKIGEDATVTVIEAYDKAIYVFGDNWARGTEILYQEMKLGMPEKVKENALASGYYALSPEVLPEFVGDYLIISKYSNADLSFQDTETYKNIPAVKNGRVLEMTGEGASFSDPLHPGDAAGAVRRVLPEQPVTERMTLRDEPYGPPAQGRIRMDDGRRRRGHGRDVRRVARVRRGECPVP